MSTEHTHTSLTALCLWLPRWAGTRKVKPISILLKRETVSSSGISWAICKSAPRSRQITTPEPHHSVFTGRMPFLTPNQQRQRVLKLPRNPPMASKYTGQFSTLIVGKLYAFSALTLLVGRQEEHPVCYNWVMRCWRGHQSGTRCRLFSYGPAEATALQNHVISCRI